MSGLIQLFRSRVSVAIIGAILVGGVGAAFGVGSVWHPMTPITGEVVQAAATATAQATNAPAATPAATATTIPTVGPIATATPFPVGSSIRGTVISTNPGANSLVISRNGTHFTILVDGTTTYTGAATQLSGIQTGWRATATVAAQNGPTTYLAKTVSSSIPGD